MIQNNGVAEPRFFGNCLGITGSLFKDRNYLRPHSQAWLNIPFQGQESFGVMGYFEHVPSLYGRC